MHEALENLPRQALRLARKAPHPGFVRPMLATLTDARFDDAHWIFERKYDGWRCLVSSVRGKVTLWSRNRKRMNAAYPELVEALAGRGDFVADGEIVAAHAGKAGFSRLQQRGGMRAKRPGDTVAVALYLFDLPWLAGYDLAGLPLLARKSVLRGALKPGGRVRVAPHRTRWGRRYFEQACRAGWEGLIAKRADSAYASGRRTTDWLKFKCVRRQELVIVGYTDPRGARSSFGALLVGYYDGGALRYAGRVGTGFDEATLAGLGRRLKRLERDAPPVVNPPAARRGVHWVRPQLVGEIGFTEWTPDGRLRHPAFLGLRFDKRAAEVVRE